MAGLDVFRDTFTDEDAFSRPRHPVRRFFSRLLLVVVLLAGAGAVYAWNYQPLRYGDTYGLRGDQVRETESVGGSSVVTYRGGESFEMIFSIRNTGRVPVRIVAVPVRELARVMASYEVRMMPRDATAYAEGDAERFRPFSLRAGEVRLLNLGYTFKNCGEPATAGSRTVRHQAVRYQLGGRLTRAADVALVQPLVITRMPAC